MTDLKLWSVDWDDSFQESNQYLLVVATTMQEAEEKARKDITELNSHMEASYTEKFCHIYQPVEINSVNGYVITVG